MKMTHAIHKITSYALMPELRKNINRVDLSVSPSVFVRSPAEGNKSRFSARIFDRRQAHHISVLL
jgi:hypothetical protein